MCLRTVGIFEKCVTEQISKNTLYREVFFDFFRHFMHSYAIKSSTFTKLGDFSLKYRNFSKFSAPAAPKMCHLTQFFPKFFQKFPFFGAFGVKKSVTEQQNCPLDRRPLPMASLLGMPPPDSKADRLPLIGKTLKNHPFFRDEIDIAKLTYP